METRVESPIATAPVAIPVRKAWIIAITCAIVKDRDARITEEDTIIIDSELITTAKQVGNVHDDGTMGSKADGSDAAHITKRKFHPAGIDFIIPNGTIHGIHIILSIRKSKSGTQKGETSNQLTQHCLEVLIVVSLGERASIYTGGFVYLAPTSFPDSEQVAMLAMDQS